MIATILGVAARLAKSKTFWVIIALCAVLSLAAGALAMYGGAQYRRGLADQLAVDDRRITALTTDLGQCRTNNKGILDAIASQNAAIATASHASADRLAKATATLVENQKTTALTTDRIARLMKPLQAADACARMQEADQRLMESLK